MLIEIAHGCGRTHRGYQSLAECMWPAVAYVIGDGPFAVLAHCDMFTVSLYETSTEARRRARALEANGCGKTCEGRHELIAMVGHLDPLPPLDVSTSPNALDWSVASPR